MGHQNNINTVWSYDPADSAVPTAKVQGDSVVDHRPDHQEPVSAAEGSTIRLLGPEKRVEVGEANEVDEVEASD